jgi:hypothetical protein
MTEPAAGIAAMAAILEASSDHDERWPAMGVRADDAPWPEPAPADVLEQRRRLVAERRDDVLAVLADAAAAAEEAAALVGAAHLADAAGRCADDLCLLAPEPGHRLRGALLCFPSHWRLHEKLGKPLAEVHDRVPGYADRLATKVDTFLGRLRVGQVAWRRNLLFHADGELHAPWPSEAAASTPPGAWWVRSERQTFRRLPETGWVLFTIRTDQVPLAALGGDDRRALAARVRAFPPPWAGYAGAHPGLLAWLER